MSSRPRNSPPGGSAMPTSHTDAFAAPAISRWIEQSRGRHYVTLIVATAIIAIADFLGANTDWRAYVVMATWIGVNGLMAPWASRPVSYDSRVRRYGWTLVIDVIFLGGAYFFLDAAQYLGVVFFAHQALTASATLPRKWALAISALIVVVFGSLVLLAVYGPMVITSPIGLNPVQGNRNFVIAGIASAVGMVLMLMHLQVRLVRSIRDAEMRYITLVQSAADMVMTFDETGHFMEVNPATLEQSGYTWEEVKALPNMGFFPVRDWPIIVNAFKRTLGGESLRLDVRYVRKDGTERWVQTATSLVTLEDTSAVLVIARDVTDARRQTEALRERDARLGLVLDALNVGFYTFDLDRRITSVFGEWAREQAANGVVLVGAHVHTLAAGDAEVIRQHEHADEWVLLGDPTSVSWTHKRADGSDRWFRSHLVPLREADGRIVGAAGLWVDETALTLAEREREQLRRRVADAERIESLGKLVSGVAHELNNPLAAILSFTEDLLSDARTADEKGALEVIQSQALRSRTIVRDLLTYARRDTARPRTLSPPGPMLDSVARAMRPALTQQEVTLTVELAEVHQPLHLDRAGFEQVVTNLLTNAAHAAGSGGSVRLTSRVKGEWFEVLVEDNGPGIASETAARMFEPFFTTKPTGQGVGLGLSVSQGIVLAHSGSLRAENRPQSAGGGARFIMRLPLPPPTLAGSEVPAAGVADVASQGADTASREAVPEPPSQPRSLPQRKPTILIIDDEVAIRQGLRRFFNKRGWNVEESADGADALSKLLRPEAARIYDVVLCDLKMAGVSGMDVFDRVSSMAPQIARRFVLSTGDTSAPDVAGFLAGVTVPVLEKPFDLMAFESLADRVRGSATPASAPAAGRVPA